MMYGYIKVYRSLFDPNESWIWAEKPFSRGQAWIDLLQMANIKDSRTLIKGKVVDVKRGQLLRAVCTLADRWGWGEKKVRTFLRLLEGQDMVTTKGTAGGTLITIENYAKYNPLGQESDTTEDGAEGGAEDEQRTSRGRRNKKERKKEENNKYTPSLEQEFDLLWNMYPKKSGRKDALRHYKAAKKQGVTFAEVRDGIMAYKNYIEKTGTEKQFIKMGSTFFCQRSWEDDYEVPARKPKSSVPSQPEPPKYRDFKPEPKRETVEMPDEIRKKLREIF